MSGQSVADRFTAARHSLAGHGLAKSVCKATTEEVMGPKKKHTDYLTQCTNEPNVSIPQLANLLIERTQHQSWVVVFKSLITVHNLMNYGNERFTQYLASNNCSFNLGTFRDKTGVQGYDMSTFIRRYAKYLNEKAISYRSMAFDFCKVKRGKEDGMLRTMNTDKLLKTLPALQQQLDALLEFDCTPNELTNGVINACFMLLFKDLIRLFACYNDGIINLLEKYFEMNKKQCKEALDIYKKFLIRMERVSEFLKVAENVGIDKGDIPDLAKAPSSLLEALEQHLASLEGTAVPGKKVSNGIHSRPAAVSTAISSLSGAAASAANISEAEKQRILDEENKHLEQLKDQTDLVRLTEEQRLASTNPFAEDVQTSPPKTTPNTSFDLLGAGSPTGANKNEDDDILNLMGGTNPFAAPAAPVASSNPWAGPANTGTNGTTDGFGSDVNFEAVFGTSSTTNGQGSITVVTNNNTMQAPPGLLGSVSPAAGDSGFDGFGQVLQPHNQTMATKAPQPMATAPMSGPRKTTPQSAFVKGDLDSSLMSLAGNLNIKASDQAIKKTDHQWKPQGEKKMTGGMGGPNMQWSTGAQPFKQPPSYQSVEAEKQTPYAMPMPAGQFTQQPNFMLNMNMQNSMMNNNVGGVPGGYTATPTSGYGQPVMMTGYNLPTAGPRPMQPGMFPQQQQGMMANQPRPQAPQQHNDPFGAL